MNLIGKFTTTAAVAVVATVGVTGAAHAAAPAKPYTVTFGGYYSGGPHTLKASCGQGATRTATKLSGIEHLVGKKQVDDSSSSAVSFTVNTGKMGHPIFTLTCNPGN